MEAYLKIKDIKLWARVGVLEEERELVQLFSLDVYLWTYFQNCTQNDDVKTTVDYSKLVEILKNQSKKMKLYKKLQSTFPIKLLTLMSKRMNYLQFQKIGMIKKVLKVKT